MHNDHAIYGDHNNDHCEREVLYIHVKIWNVLTSEQKSQYLGCVGGLVG